MKLIPLTLNEAEESLVKLHRKRMAKLRGVKTKAQIEVQCACSGYHSAWYSLIRKNNTRTGGGPCGLGVSAMGLPFVNGVRYRFTVEMIGSDPNEKPSLDHYIPNYAQDRLNEAVRYFRSKSDQRAYPKARAHMRSIINAHALAKRQYEEAMRLWKLAQENLPVSHPIPEANGSTYP